MRECQRQDTYSRGRDKVREQSSVPERVRATGEKESHRETKIQRKQEESVSMAHTVGCEWANDSAVQPSSLVVTITSAADKSEN